MKQIWAQDYQHQTSNIHVIDIYVSNRYPTKKLSKECDILGPWVFTMEESREQCTVVFAKIVMEPAKHTNSLAGSATIYAKTTVHCSRDSSMVFTVPCETHLWSTKTTCVQRFYAIRQSVRKKRLKENTGRYFKEGLYVVFYWPRKCQYIGDLYFSQFSSPFSMVSACTSFFCRIGKWAGVSLSAILTTFKWTVGWDAWFCLWTKGICLTFARSQ